MNDMILLVIGALLAIIGGGVSDELRAWRSRSRERSAIKISLADELQEIERTIETMHEVWKQAQLMSPAYVEALSQEMSAYNGHRSRLFLIKDKTLRKNISGFYKKLKDLTTKAEGRLGTLADTPEAKEEQSTFDASFQDIAKEAKDLYEKIK